MVDIRYLSGGFLLTSVVLLFFVYMPNDDDFSWRYSVNYPKSNEIPSIFDGPDNRSFPAKGYLDLGTESAYFYAKGVSPLSFKDEERGTPDGDKFDGTYVWSGSEPSFKIPLQADLNMPHAVVIGVQYYEKPLDMMVAANNISVLPENIITSDDKVTIILPVLQKSDFLLLDLTFENAPLVNIKDHRYDEPLVYSGVRIYYIRLLWNRDESVKGTE